MKKILYFTLIALIFSGCSSKGRPADLDDEHYENAKQIAVVIDNYLDKRLTERESYEQIDKLCDIFSSTAPSGSTESNLYNVVFKVKYTFFNGTYTALDLEEMKEFKEEILDYIGE